MTKISRKLLDSRKLGEYINNLWSAFTLMDSKENTRLLFKDLFTRTEFQMLAKRLEIARRLIKKEGYQSIQIALGVTSGTVGRISDILGSKGDGFRKACKKLEQIQEGYLKEQKEVTDNLSNPFRKQLKNSQKTVIGESIKIGIIALDKAINKKIKQNSAKKILPV